MQLGTNRFFSLKFFQAEIEKMPEDQYVWFTRYIWQLDEDLWAGPPFEGANLLVASIPP